jgi:hypothetical protein
MMVHLTILAKCYNFAILSQEPSKPEEAMPSITKDGAWARCGTIQVLAFPFDWYEIDLFYYSQSG